MKNIVIIGFMGAGKSTLLNEIRKNDFFSFMEIYDLDAEIEKKQQKSVSEIINQEGLSFFRENETSIFEELMTNKNVVIACGGGIIEEVKNIKLIQEAICIFLDAPVEVLFQRISGDKRERPLAKIEKQSEYNFEEFKRLYESRLSLYKNTADLNFNTYKKNFETIISEMLSFLE